MKRLKKKLKKIEEGVNELDKLISDKLLNNEIEYCYLLGEIEQKLYEIYKLVMKSRIRND